MAAVTVKFICEDCGGAAKWAPKHLRRVFEIMARGKCPPDFERAFFTKLRLDSDEYRKFEELSARGQQ